MSGEEAHEHIEHLGHAEHGHDIGPAARRAAVVIAVLAVVLALTEFAGKSAQVAYLADHIAATRHASWLSRTLSQRVWSSTTRSSPRPR